MLDMRYGGSCFNKARPDGALISTSCKNATAALTIPRAALSCRYFPAALQLTARSGSND
jgi:hypothetical protein